MEYLDFEKPIQELEEQYAKACRIGEDSDIDVSETCKQIEKKLESIKKDLYANLSSWQRVQLSRHPDRPYTLDYIEAICGVNFIYINGARIVADAKSVLGVIG